MDEYKLKDIWKKNLREFNDVMRLDSIIIRAMQEAVNQDRAEQLTTPVFVRSYFKNCGSCGEITTGDRWVEKTERNLKDHYRPICKKCGIWSELPIY